MSKVALLTDVHLGVRNDLSNFHENNQKFFSEVFIPTLKQNDIKHIINLGDMFDNRRAINVYTIKTAKQYLFTPLQNAGITMDVIQGNHDIYYKQYNHTSSLQEIISHYPNINLFEDVQEKTLFDQKVLYIPWITNSNREQVMQMIAKTSSQYVFAHLELNGYYMYKHQLALHGDDPKIFEKFKHVFSGHYHFKNSKGNITYLGSNQQHTWADAGDIRGFHILDSQDFSLQFIANPFNMFEYVKWDENFDYYNINYINKYVRIVVDNIEDHNKFDKFKRFVDGQAINTQVVYNNVSTLSNDSLNENVETMHKTIDIIKSVSENSEVTNKLVDLYNQAILL